MHKKNRLSKNQDFTIVYKKGKSYANRSFVVYYYNRKDDTDFRLGVSVSKKIGNAVTRNRIKRLVKAVFLENKLSISNGYDFVIIARHNASKLSYNETKSALLHLLMKGNLYKNQFI